LTPSINFSLLLKHCDPKQFFGKVKEVVITRSEIRALRRLVKQLPVEMLQQCSSVSSCMQMRIVMEEHYTMSTAHTFYSEWPYAFSLVFCNTLLALLWPIVA
jgi:hypothetical protein